MPNAYEIMGQVRRNMRQDGKTPEEIAAVIADMKSSDYDHLCEVALQYI